MNIIKGSLILKGNRLIINYKFMEKIILDKLNSNYQ